MFLCLKPLFDGLCDYVEAGSRFEASHHLTLLVNEELGEVPLDVCAFLVVRISLREHLVENRVERMSLVPACEAFAFLEEFEERSGIITIYLDLFVALKFCAVCKFAELMDAFISTNEALKQLPVRGKAQDTEKVFKGLISLGRTNEILPRWAAKAGIQKHITFHSARHTHATMMITLGADLYTVSKLLGHTNIQTTQIYAKIVDESKEKAIDLIPDIT